MTLPESQSWLLGQWMPGGVHRAGDRDGCMTDLPPDSSQITPGGGYFRACVPSSHDSRAFDCSLHLVATIWKVICTAPEPGLTEAASLADPLGPCAHEDKPDILCCLMELNSVTLPPSGYLMFVFLFFYFVPRMMVLCCCQQLCLTLWNHGKYAVWQMFVCNQLSFVTWYPRAPSTHEKAG